MASNVGTKRGAWSQSYLQIGLGTIYPVHKYMPGILINASPYLSNANKLEIPLSYSTLALLMSVIYASPLQQATQPCASQYYGGFSLSGALSMPQSTPQRPQYLVSYRSILPQESYTPTCKWQQSTGTQNLGSVSFDFHNYYGQGIPLSRLMNLGPSTVAAMSGAYDQPLASIRTRYIILRILWPGYASNIPQKIAVYAPDGSPITRAHLGQQVARAIAAFVQAHRKLPSSRPKFRISDDNLQLGNLVLISLRHVIEDSWQAEIAIDWPSNSPGSSPFLSMLQSKS